MDTQGRMLLFKDNKLLKVQTPKSNLKIVKM